MNPSRPKLTTGRAWLLATVGVGIIGVGRLFGLIELFVLGSALVILVLLAVTTLITRRVPIGMQRTYEPIRPAVGETLDIQVVLNTNGRTPSCQVVETLNGQPNVNLSPASNYLDDQSTGSYRLPLTHRGVITLGPVLVQLFDPMEIFCLKRILGDPQEVLVMARSVEIDLPDPQYCRGELIDQIRRQLRNRSANLEFHSIRDYRVGDDARSVNWKASAKREDLVINEYQSFSPIDLHLIVDTESDRYSTEGFERAVSIATSFARQSERLDVANKMKIGFTIGPETFGHSEIVDMTHISKTLALAELSQVMEIPHIRRRPESITIDVIITGVIDSDWNHAAWVAHGSSRIVVVISCDQNVAHSDFPAHWLLIESPTIEAFALSWSALSSRQSTR